MRCIVRSLEAIRNVLGNNCIVVSDEMTDMNVCTSTHAVIGNYVGAKI